MSCSARVPVSHRPNPEHPRAPRSQPNHPSSFLDPLRNLRFAPVTHYLARYAAAAKTPIVSSKSRRLCTLRSTPTSTGPLASHSPCPSSDWSRPTSKSGTPCSANGPFKGHQTFHQRYILLQLFAVDSLVARALDKSALCMGILKRTSRRTNVFLRGVCVRIDTCTIFPERSKTSTKKKSSRAKQSPFPLLSCACAVVCRELTACVKTTAFDSGIRYSRIPVDFLSIAE